MRPPSTLILIALLVIISLVSLLQQTFSFHNQRRTLSHSIHGDEEEVLSLLRQQSGSASVFNQYNEAESMIGLPPSAMVHSSPNDGDDTLLDVDKTVLAMIVFGNATKQNHVQRCIRSARTRGEWKGRIVILTDSKEAYSDLVRDDPLIHLLHPQKEDTLEELPEFRAEKMKFKRFKTLLIDYMSEETALQDVEYTLYLDIDIVVCQPIAPWLRQKWTEGLDKRRAAKASNVSIMWMFDTGFGKAAHSGVILLHTRLSRWCLQHWREIMDRQRMKIGRDQKLIRNIRRRGEEVTKCKVSVWPKNEDLLFPMQADFENRRYVQFVHITNTFHAAHTDAQTQQAFLEDALNLTVEERQRPNSLAIVPEGF